MTKRYDDEDGNRTVVFEAELPQQCDDCGKVDELRPYGPGGSKICFDCGQKDPEGTRERYVDFVFGGTTQDQE